MSLAARWLSILFTSAPALVWLSLILLADDDDYFWIVYIIVGIVFLAASLFLGAILPALFPKRWGMHPGFWLAGQGLAAWTIALLSLAVLNLTPLCIGQDNGDGINDLSLCAIQTTLVALVYSIPQSGLLILSAFSGALIINSWGDM